MAKDKKIAIKNNQEIEVMKEGGRILAWVMKETIKKVRPGVTTKELDKFAERLIIQKGGQPSFKMVPKYKWATCMCVNDCVVHGAPSQYRLKEGDVLSIDIGIFFKGFHVDMARTLRVRTQNSIFDPETSGEKTSEISRVKLKTQNSREKDRFLETGKLALQKAIRQVKIGNRVGHISQAIQETVESVGYSVVKKLVGHGVGHKLHEPPQIPCFLKGKIEETPALKKGMTLAIEVIYNLGKEGTVLNKKDGWSVLTQDGQVSGLFENTVAITKKGPLVLTKLV